MSQWWPYASAFGAFLVVFLPFELTALRSHRDHTTLSEYFWKFEGKSGVRKGGVFLSFLGLGLVFAGHLSGYYLK